MTWGFCRMHGEPLLRDEQRLLWQCPEYVICGTYVTDEFIHRRRRNAPRVRATAR